MPEKNEIRPGQSVDLLKHLHILTRDGRLNQDSRRKLKQVYHLLGFVENLLQDVLKIQPSINLVDVGAGKSYLGFLLYDLSFKALGDGSRIFGVEFRDDLVTKSRELAMKLGFSSMQFLQMNAALARESCDLPERIDIVTALHACDTATDDAIQFALARQSGYIVLVPCCQAEVAKVLRKHKAKALASPISELWRHPIHTREFASHVTNVLRCLQLEAHGYQISVTELVGWEHSLKNELIIARRTGQPARHRAERLKEILRMLGLQDDLGERFSVPN